MEIYSDVFSYEFSEFEPLFIGQEFRHATYGKGTILCDWEDYGKKLYYIKKGAVIAIVMDENGKEYIPSRMPVGTIIPLNCYEPREYILTSMITLQAMETTSVIEFEPKTLRLLILANPDFALRCFEHKAKEENLLMYRIVGFTLWDSQKRVCEVLNTVLELHRKSDGDDANTLVWSQVELAHALGLSRGQFARIIQSLKAEGVIETSRNKIIVLDKEKLREMGDSKIP